MPLVSDLVHIEEERNHKESAVIETYAANEEGGTSEYFKALAEADKEKEETWKWYYRIVRLYIF